MLQEISISSNPIHDASWKSFPESTGAAIVALHVYARMNFDQLLICLQVQRETAQQIFQED